LRDTCERRLGRGRRSILTHSTIWRLCLADHLHWKAWLPACDLLSNADYWNSAEEALSRRRRRPCSILQNFVRLPPDDYISSDFILSPPDHFYSEEEAILAWEAACPAWETFLLHTAVP